MGITGTTSALGSLGLQYDFTKITNEQFLTEVEQLGSDGKLSKTDEAQLAFIAQGVDTVPINGPSPSVQDILADPTQHNFISHLGGDDLSANIGGSVGGSLYDSLLKDLETYQGTPIEQSSRNISTKA